VADDGGLSRVQQRLRAIPIAVREAMQKPLKQSGDELAAMMKSLAPEDTGALKDSIEVTTAGNSTPPYSQPGGETVVAENAVMVTVGGEDVRYPHLVEYGTGKTHAQPFFWPSYHLLRRKIAKRLKRAASKAARDNWGSKS
jgi:HK97 gp10 family phage protein